MATQTKLTEEQLNEGLETFSKWFPEEAENIQKHRDAIIRHIVEGTNPDASSPLLAQSYAKVSDRDLKADLSHELTPCIQAIAVFIADVVFFLLGLVGLHVSNQERITRALLRELGEDTLRGFLRLIHEFNSASGAVEKAKALFSIFSGIYKAGGFSAVFKVIKDEMTWWEWLKTGVIAAAQITAWFATDGAAFIAEVALNIMSAEQLIEDGIKVGKCCP